MISFADSKAVIELEDRIQGSGQSDYHGASDTKYKVLPPEQITLELESTCRHELKKSMFSDHQDEHREGYYTRYNASKFFQESFPPCIVITIVHSDISDGLLNIT